MPASRASAIASTARVGLPATRLTTSSGAAERRSGFTEGGDHCSAVEMAVARLAGGFADQETGVTGCAVQLSRSRRLLACAERIASAQQRLLERPVDQRPEILRFPHLDESA